jgi:hypothetical protein
MKIPQLIDYKTDLSAINSESSAFNTLFCKS